MEIGRVNAAKIEEEEEEEFVQLDESFFVNESYNIRTFVYGSHVLDIYCLQAACTDYDLTGQLIWPGAELLNHYLVECQDYLSGKSAIELGSGVGISGLLCSKFCRQVVMTDCSEVVLKVLKKNADLLHNSEAPCSEIYSEKLEWGNKEQLSKIQKRFQDGFDLVIGADICFQQSSIPLLFDTVEALLRFGNKHMKFILAYVSRYKSIDELIISEARKHHLQMQEIVGTRRKVADGSYEGVIFEYTLI